MIKKYQLKKPISYEGKPYDFCGVAHQSIVDILKRPDWCPLEEVKK